MKNSHAVPSWLWTVLIGLSALVVRLFFFLQFQESPFFTHPFSDSLLYVRWAEAIGSGTTSSEAWFLSPLYAYLLAGVRLLFGDLHTSMRVFQILMGTLAIALLHRIMLRRVEPLAAGLMALVAALYPPFVFHDSMILTESLTVDLMIVLLWFWLNQEQRTTPGFLILGGTVLGLLVVMRTVFFVPALVFLILFAKEHLSHANGRKRVLWITCTTLVVIAPWVARNMITEGVLVPITASGGFNFYVGNHAGADGMYSLPDAVDLYRDPNGKAYVERTVGRALTSAEVSDWWFDKGWTWIRQEPGQALSLTVRKVLLFFTPEEVDQMGMDMGFIHRHHAILPLYGVLGFPLLFGLALLGILVTWKDPMTRRLSSLFLSVVFVTALFFVNGRLRLPVLPILCVLGASGLQALVTALRTRVYRSVAWKGGAVAAVVLIMSTLSPTVRITHEQEYVRLGEIAFDQRRYSEALDLFTRSLAEKPSFWGYMNAANAHAALGQTGAAESRYAEALRINPEHPLLMFNLGNLAFSQNRFPLALQLWKRSVDLDPTFAPAWKNLGLLLTRTTNPTSALPALDRYLQLESDPQAKSEVAAIRDSLSKR